MAIDVKSTKGSIIVGSLALVCLGAGILIGHLITHKGNGDSLEPSYSPSSERGIERMAKDKWIKEKDVIKKLIERVDTKRLRENLRYLTEKPHIAGSDRDVELATYIHDKFQEAGFDSSEMVSYNTEKNNLLWPRNFCRHN